jgi:hypothetical protein
MPNPIRRDTPTWPQVCKLTATVIAHRPHAGYTDLKDIIARYHLKKGFAYDNDQIGRAIEAVQGPSYVPPPRPRTSPTSAPASGPLSPRETHAALMRLSRRLDIPLDGFARSGRPK